MKNCLLILLLLINNFYPFTSPAAPSQKAFNQQQIEKILAASNENLNIGILVQDIDSGETIYSKNSDRYFQPASNQKLITAFAALNYLNPNFTYQTRLFIEPRKINNGLLNDNLHLQFTGDPTLTIAQLDQLFAKLSQTITQIKGDIIVDDSAFDDIAMSPGTTWDDRNYCFGSPLSAIILEHNCTGLIITPTEPQRPAHLASVKDNPQFLFFINDIITQNKNGACKIEVKLLNETTYHLSGCINLNSPPKMLWLAIANPRINLQQGLLYLLKKYQISFNGTVKFQKISSPLQLFASAASHPMPILVNTMLKESDNTIANALFKTLGAFYGRDRGDWQNGSQAVRGILSKTIHLNIPKTTLVDGAGVSRYNFLTPAQLLMLLRQVYYSNNATWFISSLPVSGIDGTLKTRMTTSNLKGKVRAKTGTETGVTSLAGYLQTKNKRTFAFAILINGFVDSPVKYKSIEDQICSALIENN